MVQFFWSRSASIWIAVLYILLGLLLLLFPGITGTVFVCALAAGTAVYGLSHLWRYFQSTKVGTPSVGELFLGVISLAFALFAILRPAVILSFLPFVLGGLLLLDGIGKAPLAIQAFRIRDSLRIPVCISALLPILVGVLLVFNPFSVAKMAIMIFGITLILDGASEFYSAMTARKMHRQEE